MILLPMLAITLVFSQYAIKTTYDQQQRRGASTMRSNFDKTEEDLSRLYMTLLDIRENTQEIRDVARWYPERISAYALGRDMDAILEQMRRHSLANDMVTDITVHWLTLSRATSLSKCYSDSFSPEVQAFISRIQDKDAGGIMEGAFGNLEMYTLDSLPSGKAPSFAVYATLNKRQLIDKLLSVDEGSLAVILGDGWSVAGDSMRIVQRGQYLPLDNAVLPTQNALPIDTAVMDEIIKEIDGQASGSFRMGEYTCFFEHSERWAFTACNLIRTNTMYQEARAYQVMMCLVVVFTLLILLVARSVINRSINRPIRALVRLFSDTGRQPATLPEKPRDTELGLVYDSFYHMQEDLLHAQEHAMEQRLALEKARYHLLEAQIDPHFLHNCFNIISHCLRSGDTDTTMEMVGYLRKYFRYLADGAADMTTLADEWTHVETYLNIQKLRFGHLLDAHIDPLAEDCRAVQLPRLIVQSLTENVFKHSVNRLTDVRCIRLSAQMRDGFCRISVWDNGDSVMPEQLEQLRQMIADGDIPEQHVGLKNTRQRIRLLNERNELLLSIPEEGGFVAELLIVAEGDNS